MKSRELLSRLGLDVILWYCAPSVFLLVYVNRFLVSADAVLPHYFLVTLTLLTLALTRVMLSRLIPAEATARLVSSMVAALLVGTMILYYGLVLIGLHSWGRVISWQLIVTYAAQAPKLAEAIEVSLPLAIGVLALFYLGLFFSAWTYFNRFDWAAPVARKVSAPFLCFLVFSGYAICAIETYSFLRAPWTRESEPLSLTLFPTEGILNLQGHGIDRLASARFDRAEDAARASYTVNPAADRRNLILIIVDALRPDHMSAYGYARDTTPHLRRLRESGLLRSATLRASCGDSSCGLLSIGSSKFLHEFSNRPFTLQEALKRHGYRIHMLLSGDHTNFYNLRRVYGEVDSYFDGSTSSGYLNDDERVLQQLAAFPAWDGAPVVMQFHLMSTHVLGKRADSSVKYVPAANYTSLVPVVASGRDRQTAINFYDNGVVQTDVLIHELLKTLERKGYLQDTVVAITADHGELLGEHGLFGHANSVHEEVLRIPFLLAAYGYAPARPLGEYAFASQVDIAPTLLAEMNIPIPETWSGSALQSFAPKAFTYFREQFDVGLIDHRDSSGVWKYWLNIKTNKEYAFNLSTDPKEERNSISSLPDYIKKEWRLLLLPSISLTLAAS